MDKIDLSYLENITDGDNEVIVEMIELFLEETPKHIEKIETFYKKEQWQLLGAEAHKVKPMFLYVGLTDLNEACQKIEVCGKKVSNLDAIPSLIQQLKEGYQEVTSELENRKVGLM